MDQPVGGHQHGRRASDIAAVVVTFNSQRHIADLLDSIPAAMGDLTHSVVVVDNGSTDRTLEMLDARIGLPRRPLAQ